MVCVYGKRFTLDMQVTTCVTNDLAATRVLYCHGVGRSSTPNATELSEKRGVLQIWCIVVCITRLLLSSRGELMYCYWPAGRHDCHPGLAEQRTR